MCGFRDGTTGSDLLQGVHTVAFGVESVHKMHLEETEAKISVRSVIELRRRPRCLPFRGVVNEEGSARCW
jgi:hypothetical protein